MSQPIQGYEPGPEEQGASKRFRVYVDKEFLEAFAEEWVACQYMDEQALAAQADATKLEEYFLYSVIEDGERVVATHAVHPERQRFDRQAVAPRPRVSDTSDLSVRAQLSAASKARFLRSKR